MYIEVMLVYFVAFFLAFLKSKFCSREQSILQRRTTWFHDWIIRNSILMIAEFMFTVEYSFLLQ